MLTINVDSVKVILSQFRQKRKNMPYLASSQPNTRNRTYNLNRFTNPSAIGRMHAWADMKENDKRIPGLESVSKLRPDDTSLLNQMKGKLEHRYPSINFDDSSEIKTMMFSQNKREVTGSKSKHPTAGDALAGDFTTLREYGLEELVERIDRRKRRERLSTPKADNRNRSFC